MAAKSWNLRTAFVQLHKSGINGIFLQSFYGAIADFFHPVPPPIPTKARKNTRIRIATLHFDRISAWEYVFSAEGMCLKDICEMVGWDVKEVRRVLLEMLKNGERPPMTKMRAVRRRLTGPASTC